jgi:flagellar protein FliJ
MKPDRNQPNTSYMRGHSFRFRLERVRELRERREEVAKQELAVALSDHFRAEKQHRAAEQQIAHARAAQLDAALSSSNVTDLLAHQAYLERTETAKRATRHDLDCREVELSDRRDALRRAARDRQALERLKDRRRAEHAREAARIEGLDLDEIAINNFRRSTG